MNDSSSPSKRPASRLVFLRSLAFAMVLWIDTILFAPLLILTFPFSLPQRYRFVVLWTRFNLWWLGITCGLHHQVKGLENIPDQPGIVMAKHQSAWETMGLQLFFRPQVWILKQELLWLPFFGWGLAMTKPIAIDRKAGRQSIGKIIKEGRSRMEEGAWVVIFPEGTRIAPGQKGRYRPGGAILAEHSGRPIVPVAHNAGEFWPKNSFMKYPGTIRMVIGPPIPTNDLTAKEIMPRVEEWIEGTMEEISHADPLDEGGN